MIKSLVVIVGCISLLSSPALASSYAVVDTNISDPSFHDSTSSGPVSAATSIASGNASGSATANLDTGILRASAIGPGTSADRLGTYATSATATIQDTITFSPGSSGTAFLDWQFDGFLTGAIGPSFYRTDAAFAYIQIIFNNNEQTHTYLTNVSDFCLPNDTDCVVGNSIDLVGSIPIVIDSGPLTISTELYVQAENGDLSNFLNTGKLFLETPEGVTYSSDSGVFLSSATPIVKSPTGAVPEPPVVALIGVGLALALLSSWRRNIRCASRYIGSSAAFA